MADYIEEKTNKAFETAKLTSYWLELAGVPEAVEYAKLIHLDEELNPEEIPHYEDMCFLNPIVHEIRYRAINHYIEQSGCRNILDLACGYSPRGLYFARKGYQYIGGDLPVVAEQLRDVVKDTGVDGLFYGGVDVTNFRSLKALADRVEGPCCVVAEGLAMYLNTAEAETFRNNIARLLREREGSVFITTDPAQGYLFFDVISSWRPMDRFMQTIGELFEMYNWASDGGITMQTAKRPLEEDLELFRKAGLSVKQYPLLPPGTELVTAQRLPEAGKQALYAALSHPYVFVADVEAETQEGNENIHDQPQNERPFSLHAERNDEKLRMAVRGRLDSLSAPEMLRVFESEKARIREVEVDLAETEFISSGGLRVFYLMKKELKDPEALKLVNVPEKLKQTIDDDEIIKRL